MKLQPADEMKKVSNEAIEKFKKDALASEYFTDLVKGIESKAEQGSCKFAYIYQGDEPRMLGVFSAELKKAGYTIFNNNGVTGFTVDWGE
ncbi:hypothetical protein FJQ98_02830 [Lysinibacillus agricola]|uniref:Uncharacterized protein n=1 Tax=Lysinibacillus agricola TaxID=2590012 RepID=A0ABX7AV69_9BACI|nr:MULTISPECIES: hypothetical protein [Lysinibacillus]KOS61703.1 hypothetical protein AN161_16150 [Lysinibacillus sp. FJAT-14222]QQP13025.1 hypothetical protein FJQ98_02830 [Lysinibacillus agricola]